MKLAESLQADKRSLEAIAVYEHALEKSPHNPQAAVAHLRIAELYYINLHRPQEALDVCQQLIEQFPNLPETQKALELQAQILEEQKQWNLAIESYAGLLAMFPQHPEKTFFLYRIGELYRRHGDLKQAELELENYLKSYPDNEWSDDAHFQLGELYFQTRQYPKAYAHYMNIVEGFAKSPHYIQSYFNAGLSLESMGEWDKALKIYKDLIGKYPNQEMLQEQIKNLEKRRLDTGRG